jgi:hypothetical protein
MAVRIIVRGDWGGIVSNEWRPARAEEHSIFPTPESAAPVLEEFATIAKTHRLKAEFRVETIPPAN